MGYTFSKNRNTRWWVGRKNGGWEASTSMELENAETATPTWVVGIAVWKYWSSLVGLGGGAGLLLLRIAAVTRGQPGTDHELDLVEDHQRQDEQTHIRPAEDDRGHRQAGGQ